MTECEPWGMNPEDILLAEESEEWEPQTEAATSAWEMQLSQTNL